MLDNAVLSSRVSGVARLFRGWVVTVVTVVLAAGGHQAAHSVIHGVTAPIPWELLGFSAALTAPVAVAFAGKRVSNWAIASTTIVGQLAFHLLYSLPSSGEHASHAMHPSFVADAVMLAAHVLAAALTIVVMVHGERSLLTVVAWLTLAPSRVALAAVPVTVDRPNKIPQIVRVWIPSPMNVTQTRSTRGPPVLA